MTERPGPTDWTGSLPLSGVVLAERDPAPQLGDRLALWLADVSAEALLEGRVEGNSNPERTPE